MRDRGKPQKTIPLYGTFLSGEHFHAMAAKDNTEDNRGYKRTDEQPPHRKIPQSKTIAHAAIGVQLRTFYDPLGDEPLPDRFAELMKRLDASHG